MKIIKQKLLSTSEGFFLAVYAVLLVTFSYYFIKSCINYSSIVEIFSFLLWIMVCIVQILVQYRSLTKIQSEEEQDKQESSEVFSEEWNVQKIPKIVAIFILLIPMMVIVAILLTNPNLSNTQLISSSEYKPLKIWSNILFAIALISQDLEKILDIKKYLVKQILTLFSLFTINFAVIMYLIYIINLNEKLN